MKRKMYATDFILGIWGMMPIIIFNTGERAIIAIDEL